MSKVSRFKIICTIIGAQPRVWAKKEVNRPNYALDNIDIAGSGPR